MSSQQSLFDRAPEPWELDEAAEQLAAQVVFAEPPHGPYDYRVPETLKGTLRAGQRVQVPLGKGGRLVVGYCTSVATKPVGTRPLKPIESVIDAEPLLSPAMLRLTAWMADYYLGPLGQVLQAVVPAGVRGQAGTREMTFLSVPEAIARQLAAGTLKLGAKQADALRILAASPRPLSPPELAQAAKCTLGPIAELRKKKLVAAEVKRISQMDLDEVPAPREQHLHLNDDQQLALDRIVAALKAPRHETILMHGVTGSGKTEVYIRAIDEVIAFGRQAIVLVPEISLTPQTRSRFRSRFSQVAVLHSHLSDAERHWHWQRIAAGEVQVIVGARSAVFAPVRNLGLIVIDEEHDHSFKQGEAPRYHARDVALKRAQFENIPLVLGSATPSLEAWHEARQGRFTLVELPRRVSDRPLPMVATIDLRDEVRSRAARGAISRQLARAIDQAIQEDGQVILLLNRRGYSTHIQCPACGFVVKCPDCDLPLTHHREGDKVVCHYCDFQDLAPARCPDCRFDGIRYSGLGTQRLEAEIAARFSGVPVLRMDSDTMQKHGSHEEALEKFRDGKVRILVGTQMIAKGLDFPNVTLVGVINADTALHFPDFRAAERTFQLVTQVAGRTGRGDKGGRVLVQTFSPDHFAIAAAVRHDYHAFAAAELPIRMEHGYPPYTGVIRLIVRGEQEKLTEQFAAQCVDLLRGAVDAAAMPHVRLLGPAPCPIAKLRAKFRFHAILSSSVPDELRRVVRETISQFEPPEGVQWVVDVDPVDLL
ncbi:MAG TPA: primosomal protein N' [Pirellulaceae bacterium]|nr:primosomal protein N' [Pirellulaceae bacterium]